MATRHRARRPGDLAGARTHNERALEIGQAALGPTTPISPFFAATSTVFCSDKPVSSTVTWLSCSLRDNRCGLRTLSSVVLLAIIHLAMPSWPIPFLDAKHRL
jgi:hypothetical protein